MYTSGTQSAYASRDHSPDSKFLPTFTLPRNQTNRSYRNPSNTITSHYPKAPPSMIITPSQTPHREQSVERANKADVDVNVVYRKLEAILASEDSEKNFNRRVAVVSGADDHYRRSTNDRNMFGESDGSDISFVPPADSVVGSGGNLPPSVTPVSDRFSFATRTLPMSMAKHLTSSCSASSTVSTTDSILTSVAMTGREARSETKEAFGSKQRSLSVSPRTARRQFYENYERVTKPQQTQPHQFQLQQPKKYIFSDYTAEHKQPGDVLGIESGFKPMYKSVVTTASACDINSTSTSTSAMSSIPPTPSSSSSVSKKFLRMFSTRDLASTDQDSSGKSGFLQSVKERRKFFGGKKASSVDSPIGVSIARIGVNILTEPAAPSNYQPPDLPDLNFPQSPRSTAPLLTPTPMTAPSISAPAVKGRFMVN